MNIWTVYKHTSPNGKIYIGITSKINPASRWDNGNGYKYNSHFYNSIKKYGWKAFVHEITHDRLTKEEACQKEIDLISEYKSDQFKYGFNQSKGGQGGRYGIPLTEQEKLRRAKAVICLNNNKTYTSIGNASIDLNLTRTAISQHLQGNTMSVKGYRFNYINESNEQIKDEILDRYIPHNAKSVIEIDSNTEFESVNKASEYYKINKNLITSVCLGKTATTHGHKFRYKDSEYLYQPRQCHGRLAVINNTTGETFKSLCAAAKAYSASDKMISACCKGLIDNAYGYKWSFAS